MYHPPPPIPSTTITMIRMQIMHQDIRLTILEDILRINIFMVVAKDHGVVMGGPILEAHVTDIQNLKPGRSQLRMSKKDPQEMLICLPLILIL